MCYSGSQGKRQVLVRWQKIGVRGSPRPELLLGFLRERQGRVNSLGLAFLNNSSGILAMGVVSSHLVPDLGMI